MINTIKKLKASYPHKFFLIIGSDILHEIKKWHSYEELLREIEFIVFRRKNYSVIKVPALKMTLIKVKPSNISSTKVRELAEKGKSLKKLVSSCIEDYIRKNKLYSK